MPNIVSRRRISAQTSSGLHARMHPEHHQIVQQVGAFADNRLGLAVHGIDHDFDRLFGQLFGHLGAAGAQ